MEVQAVAIVVLGWLAGHFLSIRAQRKALINQITNEARLRILERLRAYQEWLSKTNGALFGLQTRLLMPMPPTDSQWIEDVRKFLSILADKETLNWIYALEEHEILIPQVRRPRLQLSDSHGRLMEALNAIPYSLYSEATRGRELERAQKEVSPMLTEQGALVEYLRIAVQNLTLGTILGRRQRMLGPRDVSLVRLISAKGALEFSFGKPPSRLALALRRLLRQRLRPIIEDGLSEQRELFRQLCRVPLPRAVPMLDCWVQGEGKRMALQVLDARSGTELLLLSGAPIEDLLRDFEGWVNAYRGCE